MRVLTTVAIVLLFAGCAATAPAPAPTAGAQTFTGEVWTWDQPNNIVTLYKDGQAFRVQTTPDQMRTLSLHSNARVTGTLAPPADLPMLVTGGPMTPVPHGQADVMEVKGTVASVDPNGRIAVTSDRGPVHVWGATGADQRFKKDEPVTVKMSVQPVDMKPAASNQQAAAASANALANASPSSEPGDHAVVTGRIIGVNPGGVLVVESPTGPIQVLVADGAKYKVGEYVEIRTTVHTAS
jgi:hypothetical protein